MSERRPVDVRLDARLGALPRGIEPARDLWPAIESRLESRRRRWPSWAGQAAAAVLLVAVSSFVTAGLVRRESAPGAGPVASSRTASSATAVVSTSAFGPSHALNGEYERARRQLAADLEQRLASLPPSARQKLESNLAEMRRAADEINAALARQPGDPLLEELLLSTYQDELGVLASVNQLTSTSVAGTAVRQENLQL